MKRGAPKKSTSDFFEDSVDFHCGKGLELQKLCPKCTDEYDDHSLLKLIAITYWVGIFAPISHKQLRERYGYRIAYIDSMCGSGVTSTKKAGRFLCGSTPGAVISAEKRGFPFDIIFINDLDTRKVEVLKNRLGTITDTPVCSFSGDIWDNSMGIASKVREKTTISYTVIDPQGLKGMTWKALFPLLSLKGDAMVTWFENDFLRLKAAASSEKEFAQADADAARLTEIFGSEAWRSCQTGTELTQLFIERVKNECSKEVCSAVRINRKNGQYYLMLLFGGKFKNSEKLVNEWKKRLDDKIRSARNSDISTLIDIKIGGQKKLFS